MVGRRTEELRINVSQREHAEETLRDTERDFEEVRRITRLGTWVWDVATGATRWSPELYDIASRDPGQPVPDNERGPHMMVMPAGMVMRPGQTM